MSRVLVIPHVLNHPVRIREFEIAKALSTRHQVTLLNEDSQRGLLIHWYEKFFFHFRNMFLRSSIDSDGLEIVRIPRLAFGGWFPRFFNRMQMRRFLKNRKFDVIINAGYWPSWAIEVPSDSTYILDIVDDHESGYENHGNSQFSKIIDDFYSTEIPKADHVVAVSQVLVEKYGPRSTSEIRYIANGASRTEFLGVDRKKVAEIKRKLGIHEKFVFGYIGGMDSFIEVPLVLSAFQRAKSQFSDIALVWVGAGDQYEKFKKTKLQDVHFVGPVPVSKSADYISIFDVGLIPKSVSRFTAGMMPIKSVEYGMARLPVISSPLSELVRLGWPNIRFAHLDVDSWTSEMIAQRSYSKDWNPLWDSIYSRYDWEIIGQQFEELF